MNHSHDYTDQELARLLSLISMADDDFVIRFLDATVTDHLNITDSDPEEC